MIALLLIPVFLDCQIYFVQISFTLKDFIIFCPLGSSSIFGLFKNSLFNHGQSVLYFTLLFMARLNKTECAIYLFFYLTRIFLLFTDMYQKMLEANVRKRHRVKRYDKRGANFPA